MLSFEKFDSGLVNMRPYNFSVSGLTHQISVLERGRGCRSSLLRIWIFPSAPVIFLIDRRCPKWRQIFHILATNFWGETPKFRDLDYKTSDHVAKFRGDRPTELGDLAKKKTSAVKHKSAGNYCSGRPNYIVGSYFAIECTCV